MIPFILRDFLPNFLWLNIRLLGFLFLTLHNLTFEEDYICLFISDKLIKKPFELIITPPKLIKNPVELFKTPVELIKKPKLIKTPQINQKPLWR